MFIKLFGVLLTDGDKKTKIRVTRMKGEREMKIKRILAAISTAAMLFTGALAAEKTTVPFRTADLNLPAMSAVPQMYTEYSEEAHVTAVWLSAPADSVTASGVPLAMQADNTAWFAYGDWHGPMYSVTVGSQTSWHYSTGEPYCVLTQTDADVFKSGRECNGSLVVWKKNALREWFPYCVAADYKTDDGERTLIAYYTADLYQTLESCNSDYDLDLAFIRTHYLTDGAPVNEGQPTAPLNDAHAEILRRDWVTGAPWRKRF